MRERNHALLTLLLVAAMAAPASAQTPAGSAPPAKTADEYTGPTLNTSLDGSADSGSQVYGWTISAGYIFNKHVSASFGVPVMFTRGTTSTGTTLTSSGVGNAFAQLQLVFKKPVLNYGATFTGAAPTGDTSKGRSTGRVTYDWTNQIAREFGRFTPYASAGAGNSLFGTRYWQRPYLTLGGISHFEAGTSFDLGHEFSVSGSAYDIAPWGTQKVYSLIVTKSGGSPGGTAKHGRVFQNNAETIGGASLDRDNGYNADLDYNPTKFIDLDLAYSHSMHFQLDTVSFTVGLNLTPLLHGRGITGH